MTVTQVEVFECFNNPDGLKDDMNDFILSMGNNIAVIGVQYAASTYFDTNENRQYLYSALLLYKTTKTINL